MVDSVPSRMSLFPFIFTEITSRGAVYFPVAFVWSELNNVTIMHLMVITQFRSSTSEPAAQGPLQSF